MDEDIAAALEVAAGGRLKCRYGEPATPTRHDLSVTRRTVALFLESLDPDLTVSELRRNLS